MKLKKAPLMCRIKSKIARNPNRWFICKLGVKKRKYCGKCECSRLALFYQRVNEVARKVTETQFNLSISCGPEWKILNNNFKYFKCENGRFYLLPKNHCAFCEYCTDIIYDYTHGPYMFHCNEGHSDFRTCNSFKEEVNEK